MSNIPARNAVSGVFCVLVLVVFLQICLSSFYRFHPLHPENIQAPKTGQSEPRRRIRWDPHPEKTTIRRGEITCDRSHPTYDLCSINGPTSVDPTTSTFYLLGPTTATSPAVEKIQPYPRKRENRTMSMIKELTLISSAGTGSPGRPCEVSHKAPAFVFSAGGYTGNFFHDFNDGFIPLFITVNSVFSDPDDVILVVSDASDWWVSKYAEILRAFSKHPIVNLDAENSTHCFTSATFGLISHRFMTINPNLIPSSKSFIDFRHLLGKAFNNDPRFTPAIRPRLVLITRTGNVGRVMLNQEEIIRAAEETGFEVIRFEPTAATRLTDAYGLVNSSHAMMGVHGAALTHLLFLRPGSVVLQVVPLGLEWVSEICFETPARLMGLEYVEYRVGIDESSLVKKYGTDDLVIKDPAGFRGLNWSNMNVYLKEQDVRLDMVRVKEYLEKMFRKAKRFTDKTG